MHTVAKPGARRRRSAVAIFAPVLVALGLTIAVLSSVTTARGRISASTATEGLLTAGEIDLIIEFGSGSATEQLLFDETGLYAGQVLQRCLVVRLAGSFDTAAIRAHARLLEGTGLAPFVAMRVETGTGTDPECVDFTNATLLFDADLESFFAAHATFQTGLQLADPAILGEPVTVRIHIEIADDNGAQDLTTSFMMFFEAQP